MTCIVGIQHDQGVTIGGDSAATDEATISVRADMKVFTSGPYLFGFCGSFRMGQLLHYTLECPVPPDDPGELEQFMATTFVNAVRFCLSNGGVAAHHNNVETGGTFLVAVKGQLFCVEDDYQVARETVGYAAIGSGSHVAYGSLHTSADYDLTPDERVTAALRAATDLTPFVRAPFIVLTQPAPSVPAAPRSGRR